MISSIKWAGFAEPGISILSIYRLINLNRRHPICSSIKCQFRRNRPARMPDSFLFGPQCPQPPPPQPQPPDLGLDSAAESLFFSELPDSLFFSELADSLLAGDDEPLPEPLFL